MQKFLRELDFFAVPVSLTYKGQRQFGTSVGGCFSLLLIILFTAYSVYTAHEMIVNPILKNSSEKLYFSYVDNTEAYEINTTNSTLAVKIAGSF